MLPFGSICVCVTFFSKVFTIAFRGCHVRPAGTAEPFVAGTAEPFAAGAAEASGAAPAPVDEFAPPATGGSPAAAALLPSPSTNRPWPVPATTRPSFVSASANTSLPSSPDPNCAQCAPPSLDRNTPPYFLSFTTPAYSTSGFSRSTRTAATFRSEIPWFDGVNVTPASWLVNTPPRSVASSTLFESPGSTYTAFTTTSESVKRSNVLPLSTVL